MSDLSLPLAEVTAGVRARLGRLRRQLAAWIAADGAAALLWSALALAAVDLVLDWYFRMDRAQRAVLLVVMVAALVWTAIRRLVRPLATRLSDEALLLRVEARHPELHEGLISAVELAQIDDPERRGLSPSLVRQTVVAGAQAAAAIDFGDVLSSRRYYRNLGLTAAGAVLVALVAYGVTATEPLAIWFHRNLLLGERRWPQQTYLAIDRVDARGVLILPRGDDATLAVLVKPESRVVPAAVYLDFRGGRRPALLLDKAAERRFETTLAGVIEPFEFRARGGDDTTEWVRVELVEQPAVMDLQLVVTPPAYTGHPPQPLAPGEGPYAILPGSRLALAAAANKPLVRAELDAAGRRLPLALRDPQHFAGEVAAGDLVPGQYTIHLEDTLGLVNRRPTLFGLRQRTDREPKVRVRLSGISGLVVPAARLPYHLRLTDDYGLVAARIHYRGRPEDASQPPREGTLDLTSPLGLAQPPRLAQPPGERPPAGPVAASASAAAPPRAPLELAHEDALELGPLGLVPATSLTLVWEATDNDDVRGPHIGRSPELLLRVVTEEELRTDLLRREKEQRQEFERLIKNQEELLTDSRALQAALAAQPPVSEPKEQLVQYQRRQKNIGAGVRAIAERLSAIVLEVQNNRLEPPGGRLQTRLGSEIVAPLRQVADDLVPRAAESLGVARQAAAGPARSTALADAIAHQTAALAQMKQILAHLVKSEGFQEAVNLLYEIQKAQTDVHEQTNKARQERIQRILEGAAPAGPAGGPGGGPAGLKK